jgi:hypothetical protein
MAHLQQWRQRPARPLTRRNPRAVCHPARPAIVQRQRKRARIAEFDGAKSDDTPLFYAANALLRKSLSFWRRSCERRYLEVLGIMPKRTANDAAMPRRRYPQTRSEQHERISFVASPIMPTGRYLVLLGVSDHLATGRMASRRRRQHVAGRAKSCVQNLTTRQPRLRSRRVT